MAHTTAISLAWEVKVSRSWESGDGFGKLIMEICGTSCAVWVGVGMEDTVNVRGAFEVSM